jgi:MFS family permease
MTTAAGGQSRPSGPLRLAPFRLQFSAEALSMVGSTLSPVALSLGVLQLTGSAQTLGIVLGAAAIPMIAFLLIGGVWADRLPRSRVMVTANIVSAVAQISMGTMLLTGQVLLWLAVTAQVLNGVAKAFYFPSINGLTAETVPDTLLQKANALLSLARSLSGSAGPFVASLLVILGNAGWALIIDGLTFIGSAILLSRLRPARSRPTARRPFFQDIREGFRVVVGRNWVWSSIAAFMISHLATATFLVLGPLLLLAHGESPIIWGAVIGCLSVGSVIGDLLAFRVAPPRPILAARLVELLAAPLLIASALAAPPWVLIATAVLGGIALTFPDALWYTSLQRHLPVDSLSRVSSYDWLGSLALRPIGFFGAAFLAAAFGAAQTLIVAAALVVASRLAGLLFADVRRLSNTPMQPQPTQESREPVDAG